MELNEYMLRSADYSLINDKSLILKLSYLAMGLSGEAGEVSNKVKKIIRDSKSVESVKEDLKSELGDVLWYVTALAAELGFSLQDVALGNLEKLEDRKLRSVISGSGDLR